jgi:DNA-binding MarR family transcriptional regulator
MRGEPGDVCRPDEVNGLDPVFLHRIRLGICLLLAETEYMTFQRLKELIDVTDGNLGAQLNNLRNAGLVSSKTFTLARRRATWFSLTEAGRRSLDAHIAALESIVGRSRGVRIAGREVQSEDFIG